MCENMSAKEHHVYVFTSTITESLHNNFSAAFQYLKWYLWFLQFKPGESIFY